MIILTESERKILEEWVSGVDLSKVKVRTGWFPNLLCVLLRACAVTLGFNIFVSRESSIAKLPPGHPLRVADLIHEVFHVKQEKEISLLKFFLIYISAYVAGRYPHPFEKPAYELEKKFLEKHGKEANNE